MSGTLLELCDHLQLYGWAWVKDTTHKDASWLWQNMAYASSFDANFLINIGPLPDGSVHPEDEKTLLTVGARLKQEGWPAPSDISPTSELGGAKPGG